jgi:hypothetical protein
MKPKNSLGGKNNHGRMSSARSSRASSTIFKKLQKLDRQISHLKHMMSPFGAFNFDFGKQRNKKLEEQIKKLDLKRKEVRLERKKYERKT